MEHVCRLCLRSEANMIPIFDSNDRTSMLQQQIQDHCSIKVCENDSLPKNICEVCKQRLASVREFREQCNQSDCKLREHFKIVNEEHKFVSTSPLFLDIGIKTSDDARDELALAEHLFVTGRQTIDFPNRSVQRVEAKTSEKRSNRRLSTKGSCNDNPTVEEEIILEIRSTLERQIPEKATGKTKFECNICQKVYVSKRALLKHTDAHMKQEILMCPLCKKAFNNGDKLAEHMKKHSRNEDLRCEVCYMPFKEQVKLNFHLRVHGKGPKINTNKQYLCDMCSRTFASKSGLRFHLKSHNGSKPYACTFCNKTFSIPSYKIRHERTHSGEKHLVCHVCSAAFASSNGLKYHLRSHTGEANYHCETCGKAFRRLKYLKEHTFTHTGERPFACKICGSAYGNSGSLFVHERKCKAQYTLNVSVAPITEPNNVVEST